MKTTKSKITKLIQEVTQEILHEYENTELDKYRIFFVDKKTNQPASYVVTLDPQFEDVKYYIDDIITQAKSKGLDLEVDQNRKPQFIGTVRVDDEGGEYNESKTIREHLAQVVPNSQIGEGEEIDKRSLHKELVDIKSKINNLYSYIKYGKTLSGSYTKDQEEIKKLKDRSKEILDLLKNRQMEESGVNTPPGRNTGPNPQYDIKRFARDVSDKLRSKFVKTGEHVIIGRLCDAVRQMIEHKMNKEGWGIIDTEYNESNNLND